MIQSLSCNQALSTRRSNGNEYDNFQDENEYEFLQVEGDYNLLQIEIYLDECGYGNVQDENLFVIFSKERKLFEVWM